MLFLASNPLVSSNLYTTALCFFNCTSTDLLAGIFFCTTLRSSLQIALIMFKLEVFKSLLRIGSGAVMILLIKLEYLFRFSMIIYLSVNVTLFIDFLWNFTL